MIIYGSRMYGRRDEVITHGVCHNCGKMAQQKSYNGRKFGHVYFIPLFPCGKASRVVQECTKCGIGSHIPEANVPEICEELAADLNRCVAASGRGEHQITQPDGQVMDTGPVVASAVEMLTVLNHYGPVATAMSTLEADSYERHVAAAAHEDIGGRTEAAMQCAKSAGKANPEAIWPLVRLAEYSSIMGRHDDQLRLLDRAIAIAGPEDAIALQVEKLGPLETLKEFGEMFEVMGQCMRDSPALAEDKAFIKQRKKVEKRALKLGQI